MSDAGAKKTDLKPPEDPAAAERGRNARRARR